VVSKSGHSGGSKTVLIIEPPNKLLGTMPHEERERCVMLLGLEAESLASDSLRVQLNVVFQPIGIRRGLLAPSDYYIATTGGTVAVTAPDAELVNHTGPNRVAVQHDVSVERETTGSRKLVPELKGKLGATDLGIKPGSIERARRNTQVSGIKFMSEEMLLASTNFGDAVEWRIDCHRGEKAVRDFLVGNLYLEATFRWRTVTKSGKLECQPSNILFFDNSRRQLSQRASLLMWFVLWEKRIEPANRGGIEVTFVEDQSGRA
jgi:hypothetical protein